MIVVNVDDPRFGGGPLGDLVGVVRGRQPGADVEELPDACLVHQVTHRATEECALGSNADDDARIGVDHHLGQFPVYREVVLAAEPVVIYPGRMRRGRVDLRHRLVLIGSPRSGHVTPQFVHVTLRFVHGGLRLTLSSPRLLFSSRGLLFGSPLPLLSSHQRLPHRTMRNARCCSSHGPDRACAGDTFGAFGMSEPFALLYTPGHVTPYRSNANDGTSRMRQRAMGSVSVSAIGLGGMPRPIEGRPDEQRSVATIPNWC